jgi:hypothetical protein
MLRRSFIIGAPVALAYGTAARAQSAIPADLLAHMQGRWVSRFPNNDAEVTVEGMNVRVTKNPSSSGNRSYPLNSVLARMTGFTERIDLGLPGPQERFRFAGEVGGELPSSNGIWARLPDAVVLLRWAAHTNGFGSSATKIIAGSQLSAGNYGDYYRPEYKRAWCRERGDCST